MPSDDNAQNQQSTSQQSIERAVDTKSIQEGLHALVTNPVVQQVAGDVAGYVRDVTVGVVSGVVASRLSNSNNSSAQSSPPEQQTPPPTNTSGNSQEVTK
jgi:hypothetical protein